MTTASIQWLSINSWAFPAYAAEYSEPNKATMISLNCWSSFYDILTLIPDEQDNMEEIPTGYPKIQDMLLKLFTTVITVVDAF